MAPGVCCGVSTMVGIKSGPKEKNLRNKKWCLLLSNCCYHFRSKNAIILDIHTDKLVSSFPPNLRLLSSQAIVSVHVNSTSGVITALGTRGLPSLWSPRDVDYAPEDGEELSSFMVTLDLETGTVGVEIENVFIQGLCQPFLAQLVCVHDIRII